MTTRTIAPLTDRLREATAAAHEEAEHSGFMSDLLDGKLDLGAVGALAGQLRFVYGALEDAVRTIAGTPVGAAIADPRLERATRLDEDLDHLLGPRWRGDLKPLPATVCYANRLADLARAGDAAAIAGHHYVRYLGDLSGGQIIARRLRDHYGIDGDGARFYDFGAVGKIKPYRDAYRARLDALDLPGDVAERAIAEAVLAFRLNTALFRELGSA